MKGFIEIHLDKQTRLININQICSVRADELEETDTQSTVHTFDQRCIYCSESYDEIKQKIEEAQRQTIVKYDQLPWEQDLMHPNAEGSKSDE
ncbi:hypothetical protein ACFP7A_01330 [Sporolactobacillus kofuensis]|uniref:Uncharacterized protein n=1 Tax=Sporolactobacillus kofuensis TaxID=269672 RepID=A0ABW1WAF5_9BACL|nr:hypothetical protein [Sporolactobacillus kofuensis]MCO7177039.1 hypothetical protein [Sporolactobacillus kofuensis]